MNAFDLNTYADLIAFVGNSLLSPMSQTETIGLDASFWKAFPDINDGGVRQAVKHCEQRAQTLVDAAITFPAAVEAVSIEYTKLFIGPPRPLVAPWESAYTESDPHIGFGEATFAMQRELQQEGLKVDGVSNQFADHIGIELLLLSVIARQVASGEVSQDRLISYTAAHPASWIDRFNEKVCTAIPDGYYCPLVTLGNRLVHLVA